MTIVVIGSAVDPVALSLVSAWPGAALCSAEDLVSPGWSWPAGPEKGLRRWVVGGRTIDDAEVRGVFVRRTAVHPEELHGTHPADRAYLAAEAYAFLVHVLATTRALTANPVVDGAIGGGVAKPERWIPVAARCGLSVASLRLSSDASLPRRWTPRAVDVVGDRCFGLVSAICRPRVVLVLAELGLEWARFVFDGRHRLRTITTACAPSEQATLALGRLLAGGRP